MNYSVRGLRVLKYQQKRYKNGFHEDSCWKFDVNAIHYAWIKKAVNIKDCRKDNAFNKNNIFEREYLRQKIFLAQNSNRTFIKWCYLVSVANTQFEKDLLMHITD